MALTDWLIPMLLLAAGGAGLWRRVDVYRSLIRGAEDGLAILLRILPPLLGLLPAVGMLRASGALDQLAELLAPVLTALGLPPETVGLMLIRPLSGSGALGVGAELMKVYGPDSVIGRTAAVMLGSSETTFYTISVYLGAAGVKDSRYAVPAALCADLVGFVVAAVSVRLFF